MLHQAVLVLAADKSKAPFYIVGGAFAVWAVVLGAIGLTNPDFPGNLGGQRVVMGISVLLMAGAIGSAIATASRAVKAQAATISKAPTAPAPAPAGPIAVSANPTGLLKFNTTAISARAGSDTFDFTNDSPLAHNFTIEQAGKVIAATPTFDHGTKSFTVTLKAGTYQFLCTVPGHAAAGMRGTLRVVSASGSASSTTTTTTAPPAGPIAVSANPTGLLKFNTTQLSARAGSDTFDFTNDSPLAHNFTIEQAGKVIAATPTFDHGTKSFTVTLKAGTYQFLCTVPGHAAAGMQGTLTVS